MRIFFSAFYTKVSLPLFFRPLIGQRVVTLRRFYYHPLVCHALDIVRQPAYVVQTKIVSHKWQHVREILRLQFKTTEESPGYQVRSLRVW